MKKVNLMNTFELSRLAMKAKLTKALQDYKLAKKMMAYGAMNC
jgi:hypothetical protein